jgi:hypothetical protein
VRVGVRVGVFAARLPDVKSLQLPPLLALFSLPFLSLTSCRSLLSIPSAYRKDDVEQWTTDPSGTSPFRDYWGCDVKDGRLASRLGRAANRWAVQVRERQFSPYKWIFRWKSVSFSPAVYLFIFFLLWSLTSWWGVFNPPQNLEVFQCFLITLAIDMMDHKILGDFLYDWGRQRRDVWSIKPRK